MLTLTVALSAQAGNDRETLYQVSTIDALLTGVYDPLAKIGEVLPHGDFGLGTFASLDGELILLDGQVYQTAANGQVRRIGPRCGRSTSRGVYWAVLAGDRSGWVLGNSGVTRSIGKGNTTVVFLSAPITVRVSKYRSRMA
jgi:hypothetical protein